MCAAVPIAVFLLALFGAMTLTRMTLSGSPNADLLVSQLETIANSRYETKFDTSNRDIHTFPGQNPADSFSFSSKPIDNFTTQ